MKNNKLFIFVLLEIVAGLTAFLIGLDIVADLYIYTQHSVPWWVGILIGVSMIFPLSWLHNFLLKKLSG